MFKNLISALQKEANESFEKFLHDLNEMQTVEAILSSWYYRELLTATTKKKKWELQPLKDYLIERRKKKDAAKMKSKIERLNEIEQAGEFTHISVSVEWKKNKMWGSNPTAEAHISTSDHNGARYIGTASGCGYDKESAAISEAINQSNEFLKAMYTIKDKNIDKDNREIFGYGSGYGIFPALEGGVGVSCYPKIFEKLGFKWQGISHGKSYDAYQVTKI